ncbi:mycothiol transferase [Knoellia sp. LjRoot47]|uniref:mycothiol transferase n=1 Tax=Knoellia sp. LjRoot47 TaxID=3342330 RepID=UPI003ECCC106
MTEPVHGSDETPWEPPLAGTEAEQVLGALDRLRWTFRWKVDGLDADGMAVRIGASTLTLGRLVKHLAAVEDDWFHRKLSGDPMPDDWADNGWDDDDDWELTSADTDDPAALCALWDRAVERSRSRVDALLTTGGLDQPVHASADGQHANLRRLLLDTIEEYGRHTGHADLLREAVDGRVGEDPPPRWRPGAHAAGS